MKKTLAALAMLTLVSARRANADVPRYQITTQELVVRLTADANDDRVHTFSVTLNPCDGTFTGTGVSYQYFAGADGISETITGTYDGTVTTFTATYDAETPLYPNYWWRLNADGTGADSLGYSYSGWTVEWIAESIKTPAPVRNHGQYVKLNKGEDDAAHSCVGMPIVSGQGS